MKSGGKTTEIGLGRKLLCREKLSTRATSACAKKLAHTIAAAKKGLTTKQQKLWREMVYGPSILRASRFCSHYVFVKTVNPWNPTSVQRPKPNFILCISLVLSNQLKFKDLFNKEHKWSDYLMNGARILKLLPEFKWGSATPGKR